MGPITAFLTLSLLVTALPPATTLDYRREIGAERCPDEEAIRRAVAVRLGHDPFAEGGGQTVVASVATDAGGLLGKVELRDAGGAVLGTRDLASPGTDCQELASALTLAIAIAVDPLSMTRRAPLTVEPAPAPVQAPAPLARTNDARWWAGPGFATRWGPGPGLALSPTLSAIRRSGTTSIGLEGSADLYTGRFHGGGRLTASAVTLSAVPCLHFGGGAFGACAVATGGVLRAAGKGLEESRRVTAPHFSMGARARYDFALGSTRIAPYLQLDAPLTRLHLKVSDRVVFTPPAVGASAGLALELGIP
jgi:hypothetical protein